MKTIGDIGIQLPEILLPKPGVDLTKWAVIACDQFTAEPEYWQSVQALVNDSPSTYHLILPEVFLGTPLESKRIQSTQAAMRKYLDDGLFQARQGLVLVERTIDGKTRHGLILALDLEKYDYKPGSQTLIRATEGTILDRLPPRIKIRQGASLEAPHIMVLVDDPGFTVIEPLLEYRQTLPKVYDFDLMLDSGHLTGYFIDDPYLEKGILTALQKLAAPETFRSKYGLKGKEGVLLFAMGDGNHSFATAKAIWEKIKKQVGLDHPARYALVELENVHDTGLAFEPIHRVLFNVSEDYQQAMNRYFGSDVQFVRVGSREDMVKAVDQPPDKKQTIGIISGKGFDLAVFSRPISNLPVGTLQPFLDQWFKAKCADKIDYVHGEDVVVRLGHRPGNLGFYLPAMSKSDLFKTVILDGALPRKTFSMGEAKEKRFYMECRQIG